MVEEQKLKMEKDREKEQKKEEVSQETYSPSLQVIIDDCMVMNMSYLLLFHLCPELIFFYDKVRMQRVVIV